MFNGAFMEKQVEIRPAVQRRGKIKLVNLSERFDHTGFTSMYAYTASTAALIKAKNSTAGLTNIPVYSDLLFVDFDNQEEAATLFEKMLQTDQIKFEVYHSGGRSIHFHIYIYPMSGPNVPFSQRHWMEQHAPLADMSIYKHTGIYRLPNTYHNKYPGNKKRLLRSYEGELLKIENRPKISVALDDDPKDKEYYSRRVGYLLTQEVGEGGRHQHLLDLACSLRDAGQSEAMARFKLNLYNTDKCFPPKKPYELEKLLRWAYND